MYRMVLINETLVFAGMQVQLIKLFTIHSTT